MAQGTITNMFRQLCLKAKIRNIFPYMLRHSRIYEIQQKLPEKIAAKFGGHSIETSEIYNHIGDKDIEKSMLENIYVTKEISPEQKNKYDKQIKELQDFKAKVQADMKEAFKYIKAAQKLNKQLNN